MHAPGPLPFLVIVLLVLLLFGGNRIGDIGKGLGEGIRNFKKGLAGDDDQAPAEESVKAPEVEVVKIPKQLPPKSETAVSDSSGSDSSGSEATEAEEKDKT